MRRRVAVTGLGVVSSIGNGVGDFWRSCLAGATRVEPIPPAWLAYSQFASRLWSPLAEPDYDAYGIGRIERLQNDRTALIAMAAAFQALEAAGLAREMRDEKRNTFALPGVEPERAGISLGTGIGGVSSLLGNFLHHALTRPKASLRQVRDQLRDRLGATEAEARDLLAECEQRLQAPPRDNPFAV